MTDFLWPGADAAAEAFSDNAFLAAMIAVEAAWSAGLATAGIIPADAVLDVDELRALLDDADRDHIAGQAAVGGNPVIPLVTLLRSRLAGNAATWLHRGLTSQDVVDTAVMLCAAQCLAGIRRRLAAQSDTLADLSDRYRHAPMAARTITQFAVPMTFGLKAANWLSGVVDAAEQVGALHFPAQFGGAGGTMAAAVELASGVEHPIDAAVQAISQAAAALNLDDVPPWHSRRTPVTRIADAAVTCTDAWGHIANDVLTLSRPEIAELSEGQGGGSSTMPHKANPIGSVQIRRAALTAPNLAASLHLAAADAAEERSSGAWHTEWDTLRILLQRTAVAAAQTDALLSGLRVHTDQMRANVDSAAQALASEQNSMAALAGRAPASNYLGLTEKFIRTQIDRSRGERR
ncbi:3-carboxy-cis,cis-muconate cycloisomerase [Gordonia sp. TBRC 11910]|uniref:3-carboxy-cis,cis-muconate cycloisomerase n=1 Tax=Gordonia asplenii TaxID=2725283 RepID=A0A848L371_9ACTN|nr:lyase family protein [Gordonia asplenii]NMO05179.1 3-carboxy-cis,cis-muconate cycloisomerase [Gordonia asplenii]